MVLISHPSDFLFMMIPVVFMTKAEKSKIPLNDIKQATNNFAENNSIEKEELYWTPWTVHKGKLQGETIAVISTDIDGSLAIGMPKLFELTDHPNIVSFIGFCYGDGKRILVREHPTGGTLDTYVKEGVKEWSKRVQIAVDIASGMLPLHNQTLGIGDLNSASIHLGEYLQAKIQLMSPVVLWNLANRMEADHHLQYWRIESAPQTGIVSQKEDIYSFGVILFELLRAKPAVKEEDKQSLSKLARSHYKAGTLNKIIDGVLMEQMNPKSIAIFSEVAYRCLDENPFKRPEISEVLQQLQKALKHQKIYETSEFQQKALEESVGRLMDAESERKRVLSDVQEIMKSPQAMDESELINKLLSTGVLIDNGEKLFSLSKGNWKKCHMLPATAVIKTKKPADAVIKAKYRSEKVFELQGDVAFDIECDIETKMLSRDTTYACNIVFQLPENYEGDKCKMRAWVPTGLYSDLDTSKQNGWKKTKIYLRAPGPIELYGDKSVPKYREDGWMEVKVWEFVYKNEIKDIPMKLKLIYLGKAIAGLTVCGIEFRPIE